MTSAQFFTISTSKPESHIISLSSVYDFLQHNYSYVIISYHLYPDNTVLTGHYGSFWWVLGQLLLSFTISSKLYCSKSIRVASGLPTLTTCNWALAQPSTRLSTAMLLSAAHSTGRLLEKTQARTSSRAVVVLPDGVMEPDS